jgi:predicted short-subunit dehydrogenase-like oxidoreductase (DUF2520 family)
MKTALIGAGNVATHIALALYGSGVDIVQVYSRDIAHSAAIAHKVGALPIDDMAKIDDSIDVFLFAVKDDAITELLKRAGKKDVLMIHTAGSVSMDVFKEYTGNYGALYPLQTFSKSKAVNFAEIPVFIEASNDEAERQIEELARKLSPEIHFVNSEQRKKIHLAAVFACNFTNFLYDISAEIVAEAGLPFDVLKPLIAETADKIKTLSPREAQTGPAVRGDKQTMNAHLELLKERPDLQRLYTELSDGIKLGIGTPSSVF